MAGLRKYLEDPFLKEMYDGIRSAAPIRSISVDLTHECNLRCKGCYYFSEGMDQFRTDGARKISFICYLNPNWKPNDGGELRIHQDHGYFDIEPIAGRLACFRSEIVEHEVLKSYNYRYSLTGWMLNMPIGLEFVADM